MADEKRPKDEVQKQLTAELVKIFDHFAPEGPMGPLESEEFDRLLESLPQPERDLKNELANYARLWECLDRCNLKMSPADADELQAAAKLPIEERIVRIREINQKLLGRLGNAGQGAQFRM